MFDDIYQYIHFKPCCGPVTIAKDHLCLLFMENEMLLLKENDTVKIPTFKDIETLDISSRCYLGDYRGVPCFSGGLKANPKDTKFELIPLRKLSSMIDKELFFLCGKAFQVLHWDNNTKFCGRCGSPNNLLEEELVKCCSKCGLKLYPKISPAIIVAITKGDEILLAHNCTFPEGLHSIIAGFLEPSETIEHCVKREVFEEVGIRIKNIKYFGSQPWPYPDSIMLGFFAEYEDGEIKVDDKEIKSAGWFSKDNLPKLPEKTTIARRMIDTFLQSIE